MTTHLSTTYHCKKLPFLSFKTPAWVKAGPGMIAGMNKTATILESHGVTVEEVSFPDEYNNLESLKQMHTIVSRSDAQECFLREYRMDKTKSKLSPGIRDPVENTFDYTCKERAQALDRYAGMRPILDKIVGNYSAIITPSVVDAAPLGLDVLAVWRLTGSEL